MGQKTNPILLRLGLNKTWKIKHSKKTTEEFKYYTFKSLEIVKFLENSLRKISLELQNYCVNCKSNLIILNLSCFSFTDKPDKSKIKNSFHQIETSSSLSSDININTKYVLKNKKDFVTKLAKTISQYFKTLPKVIINFSFFNKERQLTREKLSSVKLGTAMLRKFKNAPFFKNGIEIMTAVSKSSKFCRILTKYIAKYIVKTKRRQSFFLSFLKKSLAIFLNPKSKNFKNRGIKIRIKGRINGADRARHRVISAGNFSVHTLKTKVEFFETSASNISGSYGIKVWASKKN